MRILSLFDGLACGMLAMLSAGIQVDRYVAYEIDKYAVQTSSHNFPMIEHRGDVFQADFTEYSGFDFLVGGSPCTYWSIAQKNNRETEASGMGWELFSQYVRALHEAQPTWFIYENNKSMSNAIRESITETFGFEPICINSALVSAQNRQRLYWVGRRNPYGTYSRVKVEQPEDRGILLKDVLDGVTDREKARCVLSSAGRTTTREYFDKNQGTMAYEPVRVPEYGDEDKAMPLGANYSNNCGGFEHRMFSENRNKQQVDMIAEPIGIGYRGRMEDGKWVKRYESNEEPKANALTTATTDSMCAVPVASTVLNINPSGKGINGAVGRIDAKSRCLTTNKGEGQKIIQPVKVGEIGNGGQGNRIYSIDAKIVTQTAQSGGMGSNTGLYAFSVCESPCIYQVPHGFNDGGIKYEKAPTLTANGSWVENNKVISAFAVPVEWSEDGKPTKATSGADGKVYEVYEVKNGTITIKGKEFSIKLADGFYIIRKLTVSECKRLQTVPDWCEFPVSDSQAYKMLGNGWTVEVISHLIQATQADELEEEQLNLFTMLGVN